MRSRSWGLTLFAGLSLVVAACGGGGSPSAGAPSSPASASPSGSASASPSGSASASASGSASASPSGSFMAMKIGVVTDVGTVNDKNFNEYTFVGARDGAMAIGAAEPDVFVPNDASEYASGLQTYIDEDFEIIVTAGFNLGGETTKAAKANPDVWFIGVDQSPICVDAEGNLDTTFTCAGNAAELLPNYVSLTYQEDQPGFLVGIIAASLSENDRIGAIGGITLCGPCIRYIQGYELGAKSVKPDIEVSTAWVTESDFTRAFNDPVTGNTFGQQFIQQNDPDVLFQVAGKTGNGVLDAACAADILGIGVDVDQALSYPDAAECIVTSAEKKLAMTVAETIKQIASDSATAGDNKWDASRDGIGISPYHDLEDQITPEIQARVDEALAGMKAGTLQTCPETCGRLN